MLFYKMRAYSKKESKKWDKIKERSIGDSQTDDKEKFQDHSQFRGCSNPTGWQD